MTRDPRAKWNADVVSSGSDEHRRWWMSGASARLAALLPQLEAADALADAGEGLRHALVTGVDVSTAMTVWDAAFDDFLAARDAHLTEGTPDA